MRPAGIVGAGASRLVFRDWDQFIPANFSEEDLKQISDWYWSKQKQEPTGNQFCIDFRELEHVYSLLDKLVEFERMR